MKSLGVILARGGSKRLPKKNIRSLHGRPLVYYTINEAKQSSLTDIVLSSDDKEILDTAEPYDISLIKRPSELAQDDTPSFSAVKHAVEEMEQQKNIIYDKIALLQPTSPLRTTSMIDSCLTMDADATVTMERTDINQFKLNGAVFVLKRDLIDRILVPKKFLIDDLMFLHNKDNILICTLLTKNLVDIDTLEDFNKAENEMKHLTKHI